MSSTLTLPNLTVMTMEKLGELWNILMQLRPSNRYWFAPFRVRPEVPKAAPLGAVISKLLTLWSCTWSERGEWRSRQDDRRERRCDTLRGGESKGLTLGAVLPAPSVKGNLLMAVSLYVPRTGSGQALAHLA